MNWGFKGPESDGPWAQGKLISQGPSPDRVQGNVVVWSCRKISLHIKKSVLPELAGAAFLKTTALDASQNADFPVLSVS